MSTEPKEIEWDRIHAYKQQIRMPSMAEQLRNPANAWEIVEFGLENEAYATQAVAETFKQLQWPAQSRSDLRIRHSWPDPSQPEESQRPAQVPVAFAQLRRPDGSRPGCGDQARCRQDLRAAAATFEALLPGRRELRTQGRDARWRGEAARSAHPWEHETCQALVLVGRRPLKLEPPNLRRLEPLTALGCA